LDERNAFFDGVIEAEMELRALAQLHSFVELTLDAAAGGIELCHGSFLLLTGANDADVHIAIPQVIRRHHVMHSDEAILKTMLTLQDGAKLPAEQFTDSLRADFHGDGFHV
jgi:hypothetical protein